MHHTSIQEQEERDYEMGCFGNEFQAAFNLSQRTRPPANATAKIDALVAKGRFVVVNHWIEYCRHTDATLGTASALVSDHATREEADKVCSEMSTEITPGDEYWYAVCPQEIPVAPAFGLPLNNDECPL